MTPSKKLTEHLGFDPTKEVGTLRVFKDRGDRASNIFANVQIKAVFFLSTSDWLRITLESAPHRIYLELDTESNLLYANFPDGSEFLATFTFSSGTLGALP